VAQATSKAITSKQDIAPWARGPFELIRHADGHLKDAADTDRRIALIGFDNAIEVCIDVFIKLHPKLRRGVELKNEDVAKATRNYHTKIEWLDKYAEEKQFKLDFSIEEIVWYHSLRNELYHSGNGMVPEMEVLESARSAALGVFLTLFGADVSPLLGGEMPKRAARSERALFPAQNDEMELLRLFIDFERALQQALAVVAPQKSARTTSVRQMWDEYSALAKTPSAWNAVVQKASTIRNQIAHGHAENISSDEVIEVCIQLMEVTEALRNSKR
jgi:hypothetical protein